MADRIREFEEFGATLEPATQAPGGGELDRIATVYPAYGSGNSGSGHPIPEREQDSGFTSWIDVCKNWKP